MGISVDTVNLRFNVKPDYDQQQLQQLQEDLKNGQKELEKTRRAMDKLAKNGLNAMTKEQREEYDKLSASLSKQAAELHRNEKRMQEYTRSADISKLSIQQLGQRAKDLTAVLNNLNPNTDEFKEYKSELDSVKERILELKAVAKDTEASLSGGVGGGGFLKRIFGSATDFEGIKTFLAGNALFKVGEMAFGAIAEYAGKAINRVKELVSESVQAARSAQGITHAFERLNQPGLLDNLRKSTHGTVTDLELMKAVVQANDFRLPLDQLGKYLEFAQLKAQQTGQSVDYMTNSIVTGLGRKSVQILDNLGISAAEIKEEMAKTGDMATAVGNIIDKQLSQAGEHFETAAEREEQATTNVANAQLELGQQMQKTFGIGNTSFSEMQAKAETFILNGLTKLIVYCQSLYDKLATVRIIVEGVKITFDTLFKTCELGFSWLIDIIKGVGRAFRDLTAIAEGVFTGNFEKVNSAWDSFTSGLKKTGKELLNDAKNIGNQWGKNVIESINRITGNAKVEAPEVSPPKLPTMGPKKPEDNKPGNPTANVPNTNSSNEHYQNDLAAREKAYRDYNNQLKRMLVDQLLTQKEYEEESRLSEKKFLADKISLQQLYGEDFTQTQGQFLDILIKEANDKYKQSKQQLQDSLSEAESGHNTLVKQLMEQQLNGELATEKEYNELKLQADIDYQRRRLEILRAAGADTTQAEQQLLQLQLQQHQQAEQQQTQTLNEESEKRKAIQQQAIEAVNGLMSSASSLFSALQQRETQKVDKKYKAQIAAAKKAGKDTTALEEQMEAEKAEIQKKYAQKQFKLQILQIIAATAQSIANIWREWGWQPPIALALSALAGAQGAIQLATAKAQADAAAGLYKGGYSDEYQEGYTRKGDPKKQAGVIPVHSNEFVANHRAVANPDVRPILDVIDRHQKMGDIQMLNATRLLEEAYGHGRYRGGYTRNSGDGGSMSDGEEYQTMFSPEFLRILQQIADNTADALTIREVRRAIKQQERMEANASR